MWARPELRAEFGRRPLRPIPRRVSFRCRVRRRNLRACAVRMFMGRLTQFALLRGSQNDIPEPHLAVIALEHDRPRRPFGAVERAAGDPWYLFFVNHCLAVERDGKLASDQGDLVLLPLAGLFRRVHLRSEESVQPAHAVALRLLAVIVLDLRFIAAAQVNAAVALFDDLEFEAELEVLELLFSDDVNAALAVGHRAVFDAPASFAFFRTQLPSRQVLAVEDLDRGVPFRIGFGFERGRSDAGPFQRRAVFAIGRAFELPAGQFAIEDQVDFHVLVLRWQAEFEFSVVEFDLLDRAGAAETSDEATLQFAFCVRDFKPRSVRRVRALNRQIPSPDDWRGFLGLSGRSEHGQEDEI